MCFFLFLDLALSIHSFIYSNFFQTSDEQKKDLKDYCIILELLSPKSPLGGICSSKIIPAWLEQLDFVKNPKTQDGTCFIYSVACGLHPERDLCNSNYISHENIDCFNFDWTCLTFPVCLSDIKIFELRNKIIINLYGVKLKTKEFYRIRVHNIDYNKRFVSLLLIKMDKHNHFVNLVDTLSEPFEALHI